MNNLKEIIDTATKLHVANLNNHQNYSLDDIYSTDLIIHDDRLKQLIEKHQLSFEEQVILLLALAPHTSPETLDIFLAKNPNFDIVCTEFGGVVESPHRGVIPTGQTAMFILAGRDWEKRKKIAQLLLPQGKLYVNRLIEIDGVTDNKPVLSGKLLPNHELLQELMYGEVLPPKLSPQFPASALQTALDWDDLVITETTASQLDDLKNWLSFYEDLKQHPEMGKRLKKGYRTLFYGPPGTGKTLTATLLGKTANRPVFRIDLSLLVSKYIGETEKNLAGVFKLAEHKSWILFFDEADALFSKRVDTQSSNDRFANQEVSYLLQRIENYDGMVVLATNFKQNIDDAFSRRFQSMVHFPKPGRKERKLIWNKMLPTDLPLSKDVDLEALIQHYELTASQINNITQACFITAKAEGENSISRTNLIKNMRLEFTKENLLFEEMI